MPLLVFAIVLLLDPRPPDAAAQAVSILPNGGFESSAAWTATGGSFIADPNGPILEGGAAGRVTATASSVRLTSQYWLTAAEPGVEYTLSGWMVDSDPGISDLTLQLEILDAAAMPVGAAAAALSGDAPGYRPITVPTLLAGDAAAWLRVVVTFEAAAPGGQVLHLDGFILSRGPSPTPGPLSSPTATPSPTPAVSPTPTPSPTPAPTRTPTATPTVFPVLDGIINGDFEAPQPLLGWEVGGGRGMLGTGYTSGNAAMLISETTSTKWLTQAVRVLPGAWHEASVSVQLHGLAEAAWLRVAWYASADGSGSQLSTQDSPAVMDGSGATARVTTGPIVAPPDARSARLRLMGRPLGDGYALFVFDDVRWEPSAAPTPPPAGAVATPTPRGGTTAPPPEDEATPPAQPAPATGGAPGGPATRDSAAMPLAPEAGMIRITEILPDPAEPGRDGDVEWIELANLGAVPVALEGYELRDNAGSATLPALTLPPGSVVVVAAPDAVVPEAVAVRLAGPISNGLGNGGDRLALVSPVGDAIDTLSYGTDTTYDAPPLPAPPPGQSLQRIFADDGSLVAVRVSATPSPGRLDAPGGTDPETEVTTALASTAGGRSNETAYLLLGIGVSALAGAAGWRVATLRQRGD